MLQFFVPVLINSLPKIANLALFCSCFDKETAVLEKLVFLSALAHAFCQSGVVALLFGSGCALGVIGLVVGGVAFLSHNKLPFCHNVGILSGFVC